jgi:hypothetical protein
VNAKIIEPKDVDEEDHGLIDTNVRKEKDTSSQDPSMPTEFLILRGRFPQMMCHENSAEDKWRCDICLSKVCEDDDPLCICELCMVVVHPSCYRKDLYN